MKPTFVTIDRHPGRSTQTIGVARALGTDPDLIHEPSVGVVGTKGDSQCYLGVMSKVEAIHAELKARIGTGANQLKMRLVQPEYTIATSDGIRNGTREMRYSLIGREVTHDALCEHLSATGLAGTIAVVACDKPPVGTLSALLEHNLPSIIMSDGPIHPGKDPNTGEALDIVSAYQVAGHPDPEYRHHIACHACPGYGSCGGMFTYNTMQTFIGVVGMQPLHMVAPPSDDPRRTGQFAAELVDLLANLIKNDLKPRDIVVRDSIRNAVIVSMAIGGSTNVVLHAPEIARAAGFADFWKDVMTPEEFNHLSQHVVPVLTDARPYGKYSMVDIDEVGGVQVIVRELLDAGLLNGDVLTCTGETLAEQVERLGAKKADGRVDLSGREALQADRRPARAGRQPVAGLLRDPEARRRRGRPRGQSVPRPRPRVRGRAGPAQGARRDAGHVPEPRHDHRALRGSERRAGHAGDARSDLAHHDAVPRAQHRRGADDRRALLGRFGRPRDRPCRSRSGARRPDRAGRGRRRDRGRSQHQRTELHRARGSRRPTPSARRPGTRSSRPMAASIRTAASPIRACSIAPAPARCRRRAAAACIPTARSGCARRARRSGRTSSCATSTARRPTRLSKGGRASLETKTPEDQTSGVFIGASGFASRAKQLTSS